MGCRVQRAEHTIAADSTRIPYLDSKTYPPADIPTKVDQMSMPISIETRAPRVDSILLELGASLGSEWTMRGREQAYILRKLAERLGVPKQVLHRRNQGYALPLVPWACHELKQLILDVLLSPQTLQHGYHFSPGRVGRLLREDSSERPNRARRIWRLLMFELWHRIYRAGLHRAYSADKQLAGLSAGEGIA